MSPLRYEAHVEHRGVPLVVTRHYDRTWSYHTCELSVPLTRPVELHVNPARGNMPREYAPLVDTGDPAFHAAFTVKGSPPDLVARALDPTLRQRLLRSPIYPGTLRRVLRADVSRGVEGARAKRNAQGLHRGWEGPGDPQVARERIELFVAMVTSLRGHFDHAYNHVAATQGARAAHAWLSAQEAMLDRAGRAKLRAILLAMIPAALLLVGLAVFMVLRALH